jgi:hypothetical protein
MKHWSRIGLGRLVNSFSERCISVWWNMCRSGFNRWGGWGFKLSGFDISTYGLRSASSVPLTWITHMLGFLLVSLLHRFRDSIRGSPGWGLPEKTLLIKIHFECAFRSIIRGMFRNSGDARNEFPNFRNRNFTPARCQMRFRVSVTSWGNDRIKKR